jgi:hypothetical protein
MSLSRWPQLSGDADARPDSRHATGACGTKPQRWLSAALPGAGVQQEKKYSADVQRKKVNITGFICTVAK